MNKKICMKYIKCRDNSDENIRNIREPCRDFYIVLLYALCVPVRVTYIAFSEASHSLFHRNFYTNLENRATS